MENNLTKIANSTTESGNLKNAVLMNLRSQATKKMEDYGFVRGENGKMYMPIALTDKEGLITINLDVSIGVNTNFKKKPTKSGRTRSDQTENVVIPNLFD